MTPEERNAAFDQAAAEALARVTPPADLRERLLQLKHTSAPAAATQAARAPHHRWWLAAAAVLLICVTGWFTLIRPGTSPVITGEWQSASLAVLSRLETGHADLDHVARQISDLKGWLATAGAPAPSRVPRGLESLASFGCKTLDWNDRKVSILCFSLNASQEVHLVMVRNTGLATSPPQGQPEFAEKDGWTTASWSEGQDSFMLALRGSREQLAAVF